MNEIEEEKQVPKVSDLLKNYYDSSQVYKCTSYKKKYEKSNESRLAQRNRLNLSRIL